MCILCFKLAPRITEVVLARMLSTLLTIECNVKHLWSMNNR